MIKTNKPLKKHAVILLATISFLSSIAFSQITGNKATDKEVKSMFYDPIVAGDIGVIRGLVEDLHISPGAKDGSKFENIPILLSIDAGRTNILKYLIKQKVNINVKSDAGVTPLILACLIEDEAMVKLLLESGANISAKGNDGKNALMITASKGNLKLLKLLLEQKIDIEATDDSGANILMMASNDAEIIQKLIDSGVKVDAADKKGVTAIFFAIEELQLDKIEILLQNKANVNWKNQHCQTPLSIAEKLKDSLEKEKIIALLKKYGAM
jgi:uncharacterized protein